MQLIDSDATNERLDETSHALDSPSYEEGEREKTSREEEEEFQNDNVSVSEKVESQANREPERK